MTGAGKNPPQQLYCLHCKRTLPRAKFKYSRSGTCEDCDKPCDGDHPAPACPDPQCWRKN